jgi:DNA adenine methylase
MDLQKATKRAALTIYLNKTCFNGLYRVNSDGKFNTPFGFPKNREICDEKTLKAAHVALQGVTLSNKSCFDLEIFESRKWNFIYFDPPYRPITPTSFVAYDKSGFNDDHQEELRDFAIRCEENKIFVMLSNSDPKNFGQKDPHFDKLFKDFDLKRVFAKRMVNSDGGKRGKISEILVTTKPERSHLHK